MYTVLDPRILSLDKYTRYKEPTRVNDFIKNKNGFVIDHEKKNNKFICSNETDKVNRYNLLGLVELNMKYDPQLKINGKQNWKTLW